MVSYVIVTTTDNQIHKENVMIQQVHHWNVFSSRITYNRVVSVCHADHEEGARRIRSHLLHLRACSCGTQLWVWEIPDSKVRQMYQNAHLPWLQLAHICKRTRRREFARKNISTAKRKNKVSKYLHTHIHACSKTNRPRICFRKLLHSKWLQNIQRRMTDKCAVRLRAALDVWSSCKFASVNGKIPTTTSLHKDTNVKTRRTACHIITTNPVQSVGNGITTTQSRTKTTLG